MLYPDMERPSLYFLKFFCSVLFDTTSRTVGRLNEPAPGSAHRESNPSEDLSELPPLLESVAGRKYHYPPAFHRLLWLLSKGLNVILIARSTEVVAYGSCGCRDFIPAAGLTFSRCCYSVVKILRDLDRSFFPFTL